MSHRHPVLPLILIFSLIPLGPLAIDVYLPSIPQMVEDFQATDSDLQITISIYVFALGICQLIAGPVSDRFGRKTSALLGLGFYVLGSLAVAFSPSLSVLYVARILQGIGASFTMVTALAWVRDNYEGETAGKWMSYMGGMTSVIPTVAPLLGGVLALLWGWQSGFLLMAMMGFLLFVLAAAVLNNQPTASIDTDSEDIQRLSCNLKDIAASSQFRIYSLSSMFSFGGLMTYIATAPIVAMTEGGQSAIWFASAFGIIGVFQLVVSFVAPIIVSKIGQRQTVRAGLFIATLGGIGLLLIPDNATIAFFAMAALGCSGFSIVVGTATALNLQPFKYCAGLATSIDGFMRMVGGATIAAVLGFSGLSSADTLAIALLLTLIPLLLVFNDIRLLSGRSEDLKNGANGLP
jgi:DHA1 family bicyclomycin/chloramphenicol resistance-like MFS transporter